MLVLRNGVAGLAGKKPAALGSPRGRSRHWSSAGVRLLSTQVGCRTAVSYIAKADVHARRPPTGSRPRTSFHGRTSTFQYPSGVVQAAGGGQHMEYLMADGKVLGCGGNANGQLCNGTTTDSLTPTPLVESGLPAPVKAISSGSNTTALLLTDGEVWTCGDNNHGQLGEWNDSHERHPRLVALPGAAPMVYAGGNGSATGTMVAVLTDGTVEAWGDNTSGQVGAGSASKAPVKLPHQATALPAATPGSAQPREPTRPTCSTRPAISTPSATTPTGR